MPCPWAADKEFLSGANRVMDEVIGGWKVSTAFVAYSGFPEIITGGSSNSNSYGSNRVNQYRKLKIAGRNNDNWFGTDPSATPCTTAGVDNGTCAFGVPANNTFGTESNGAVRGPGYLQHRPVGIQGLPHLQGGSDRIPFRCLQCLQHCELREPGYQASPIRPIGNVSLQGPRSQERHLQFSLHYDF